MRNHATSLVILALFLLAVACTQEEQPGTRTVNGLETGIVSGVPTFISQEGGLPEAIAAGTLEIERRDDIWCIWLVGADGSTRSPVRLLAELVEITDDNRLVFDGYEMTSGDLTTFAGGSFEGDLHPCDDASRVLFAAAVIDSK